jgi:tRNA wybutosine-synthesizing protein 4
VADPFLPLMEPQRAAAPRRSPIINRGYYIRMKAVQHIITSFLQEARNGSLAPTPAAQPIQIVSLGAGYDTLYFRLRQQGLLGPNDVVFELDLPKVAQKKAAMIEAAPELMKLMDPPLSGVPDGAALAEAMRVSEEIRAKRRKAKAAAAAAKAHNPFLQPPSLGTSTEPSPSGSNQPLANWTHGMGGGMFTHRYRLIGADLCHTNLATARLRAAGLQPDLPTLVLTECVLTYLGPQHADSILAWIAAYFQNVAVALYEQIVPNDAFGTVMQTHFLRQGIWG